MSMCLPIILHLVIFLVLLVIPLGFVQRAEAWTMITSAVTPPSWNVASGYKSSMTFHRSLLYFYKVCLNQSRISVKYPTLEAVFL